MEDQNSLRNRRLAEGNPQMRIAPPMCSKAIPVAVNSAWGLLFQRTAHRPACAHPKATDASRRSQYLGVSAHVPTADSQCIFQRGTFQPFPLWVEISFGDEPPLFLLYSHRFDSNPFVCMQFCNSRTNVPDLPPMYSTENSSLYLQNSCNRLSLKVLGSQMCVIISDWIDFPPPSLRFQRGSNYS